MKTKENLENKIINVKIEKIDQEELIASIKN